MAQFGQTNMTPVVKNIIIANVLVFVAQNYFSYIGKPLEPYAALWSLDSGNFKVWQLVTHLFMHYNFYHILFNMLGLWWFGSSLEDVWGSKRFLQFYVVCGLAAGLSQMLLQSGFQAMGASGAIMGVMAAFAYLFPNSPIYLMLIPIPIKAKYVIGGYILMDVLGQVSPQPGDTIGHLAHLGGAVAGLIIVIISNRSNRRRFY